MATFNFLDPTRYQFTMRKLPEMVNAVQKVNLPGIRLGRTNVIKTPWQQLITPGDHMTWEEMRVTFKVDEDMKTWSSIFDWITALGRPENDDAFVALAEESPTSGNGAIVDAALIINDSSYNPVLTINFYDVVADAMSGFELDSTLTDTAYVTATASFLYRSYNYARR